MYHFPGGLLSEPTQWAAAPIGEPDPWEPLPHAAHNTGGGKQQRQQKKGAGAGDPTGKNQQKANPWSGPPASVVDNARWANESARNNGHTPSDSWGVSGWGTGYDDEEEEQQEEQNDPWGRPGEHAWSSESLPQTGWRGWSEEAKRNSKSFGGTTNTAQARKPLTPTQQAQMLHSLLQQPTQNPYPAQNPYSAQNPYPAQNSYPAQHPYPAQHSNNQKHQAQQQEPKLSKKQKKQLRKEQQAVQGNARQQHAGNNQWSTEPQYGWGPIEEEEEEEEEEYGRRVHFTPAGNAMNLWATAEPEPMKRGSYTIPQSTQNSSYTMPSKTLTHAYKGTTTSLELSPPYNSLNEYTSVKFEESHGEALEPVHQALFGRARLAKDRIHWIFRPDHDPRVVAVLNWIQAVSCNLGTYGVSTLLHFI